MPKGHGEHPALEVDTEQHLIDWIIKNAQNDTAVNQTELLHYCSETFGRVVHAVACHDNNMALVSQDLDELLLDTHENCGNCSRSCWLVSAH
jgi:hypothetical protein